MKKQKKWYDYLWIVSMLYLTLGFFNIMFAWLGLICFFVPLIISIMNGNKSYCNKYCGRGQLFGILGGKLGFSRKKMYQNSCPMGTMTQEIYQIKNKSKFNAFK